MSNAASTITEDSHGRPTPELTLAHLDALPTLGPIAVKLLQVTSDDASSARDVVETLRGDQSLTAKIISLANSPLMGGGGKIASLDRAVVLLGFKTIRAMVLTVRVFECLGADDAGDDDDGFNRTEFWKHSLAVACASRRLAEARPELNIEPEEAFVAGLLHDLGKVALDAVFPKAYARAALRARKTRSELADCERAVLGVDHSVAGRHVAKHWSLPKSLREAIWLHHVAVESLTHLDASLQLVALVQFANTFTRERRIGHSGNFALYESSHHLGRRLGLADVDLDDLARKTVSDVAQYVSLLGLDQATPESLYFESLSSANAELGRANMELLTANRRMSAAARYFKSITQFDQQLDAQSDLAAVVDALASAAATALQRPRLVAFGFHNQRDVIEACYLSGGEQKSEHETMRTPENLADWLASPDEGLGAVLAPAPPTMRALLAPYLARASDERWWLLPILHDGRLAGGVLLCSPRNERSELAHEVEELRSFLSSLGLALGRANAQAAARRLSEDLAESNRRLQRMQAEVLRTRTLSIIAEMAAGAGHEMNGPLTVISGRAQLLEGRFDDPEVQKSLTQIHRKAHECARIVTDLMDFAKPHPPHPRAANLSELLTDAHDAWLERSGMAPSQMQLELLASDGPTVFVDPEQARTVLDEVLGNAVQAVESNNGMITISYQTDATGPWSTPEFGSVEGLENAETATNWVEIIVKDTGCGMHQNVLERIFDPFYSHRPAGRGRGLGLARAHRIVEAHGGRIWATSQPGDGAEFHITLPQISTD